MLIPKQVLLNINSRLKTFSTQKLETMLEQYKNQLVKLKNTASKENYNYLSFPIEQKIQLIQNELNKREQVVSQ